MVVGGWGRPKDGLWVHLQLRIAWRERVPVATHLLKIHTSATAFEMGATVRYDTDLFQAIHFHIWC